MDAADKQWHLTSPTPYDPPLTYNGWTQSRALGARIASILRSRETDDEVPTGEGEERKGDGRKRRHKVIIHTSPFLRCVQTSVAISAGLAQNPGHTHSRSPSITTGKATPLHSSPRMRPTVATGSPRLTPIPEPASKVGGKPHEQPENIKKSTVRVDAFLGEWLSPDYFEQITPPPSSIMMVAGAKADLLRREEYSNLIHVRDTNSASSNQGFPGGWGSPVVVAEKDKDEGALAGLSSLGAALPRRDRTNSLTSVGSNGTRHSNKSATNLSSVPQGTATTPDGHGIYQPPIPSYAISGSDPIPAGYTAHARDACVDVDYQWDSMREPQNWGNGGEYGEEWSSMHKRFRKGLQHLVSWYRDNDDPGKLLTKTPGTPGHQTPAAVDDVDDEDTDLVIILVTHGAGCNALIGALTNQPVLLDVGMASLTMAVRKPTPKNTPTTTPGATPKSHSRASSKTLSISDEYDVKLVANTEHLRTSSSSTPSTSRTPSLAGISAFRDRYGTGGSLDFSKPRPISVNSNFGSIRRTASVAGSTPRSYASPRQGSIGLWSAPQPQEETEEQEDDMILNFGDNAADEREAEAEKENEVVVEEKEKDEDDEVAPLGLWGTPRPPGYAEKIREIAPKRRWTVNERG